MEDAMSEANSNEKKNTPEKENHTNASGNHKNYKNGNGQRNYHQRRPHNKGNNRNNNVPDGDKNPSQNNANVKKENPNGQAKDSQNTKKHKNGCNVGLGFFSQ